MASPDSASNSDEISLTAGIALFNRGDYYGCHDVLEAIWMEAEPQEKPFYQGILQIAVGLYHLGNHNWQGASILLGEGVNRLRAFEPCYQGVDVASAIDCGWAWLMALHQTGSESVASVAQALIQTQAALPTTQSPNTPPPVKITVKDIVLVLPTPYLHQSI